MTDNIDEEVLERLEAEALTNDAEPEELTIAVESEIEELQEEVEEKESEVEELQEEVEEKESEVEEKESEIEELQEEVDSIAEDYAEELASHSEVLDKEEYLDKFSFEELREKLDEIEEASPAPNSGDPGAGVQTPEDNPEDEGNGEPDLSETEELAASSFKDRAKKTGKKYWAEIAEEIESE